MKRALVLALLLAACGDGDKKTPDGGMQPTPDGMPDAPGEQLRYLRADLDRMVNGEMTTLTSYVIDLVTNGTSSTEQPRPYSEFSSLPDPDTANAAAYSSLF